MALQSIENVRLAGLSACVPKNTVSNIGANVFKSEEDARKFVANTGIKERRITDRDTCSSDLCYHAAERLIQDLDWEKEEIQCLVFITQTPDYVVPATSCILQDRLGLSKECLSFDVTLGCSAWTYGLSIIGALLSSGAIKKGLLLVGETTSKTKSDRDKSTYPLFGDAGTATALEYEEGNSGFKIHSNTDGSKYRAIYIPDGGFRNPVTKNSLEYHEVESGIIRNKVQYIMDGAEVFTFAITKAPKSMKKLIAHFSIDWESIDFLLLHQANMMMVDRIRKKVKIPEEKTPVSLEEFGNTSCSSIPLTMVYRLRERLSTGDVKILACGFGSGFSLATAYLETDQIVCPPLIEI